MSIMNFWMQLLTLTDEWLQSSAKALMIAQDLKVLLR